jgi:hypothetical protein
MRTRFIKDEAGRGAQEILPHTPFKLQIEDVSTEPAAEREAYVARRVREEIGRPFSLTQGDLSRVHLIRLGSREHVLLITQHHIISDGWSVKNMFADLKRAFLAHQNREPLQVSELPLTYIDYARWFNSPRFLDYHAEFKPFWVDRLGGSPEVHGLPLDKPRPAHQDSGGELVFSTIESDLWESFKRLCQRHSTSNFIGLHALFALLMVRQSGEKEVVIGTPLAYRERHEIESLVGFFVNTLVLRTQLSGKPSFVDYLQQCREEDLAAFDHQLYRFEALAEAIGADRTTAINPIFQIMLVYQAKVDFNDLIPGCQLVEETSPVLPAKTDISVKVTELMDSVRVDWLFATALFERETIQAYADRLLHLMRAVVAAPETDIWQLPLEAGTDQAAMAAELADLPRDYPSRDTLLCHIERRAIQLPDALAVSDGAQSLTYGELETRANRLAHWLHLGRHPGRRHRHPGQTRCGLRHRPARLLEGGGGLCAARPCLSCRAAGPYLRRCIHQPGAGWRAGRAAWRGAGGHGCPVSQPARAGAGQDANQHARTASGRRHAGPDHLHLRQHRPAQGGHGGAGQPGQPDGGSR